MRQPFFFAAALMFTGMAFAQDNTGSIDLSTQSESTSSITSTSSRPDPSSTVASVDQSSPEMTEWIKSNAGSGSSGGERNSGIGFDRDNDDNEDDQPRWAKPAPSRPKPEQIDGSYRVSAKSGPFLCTVRLTHSPFFGGYFATTSAGCPELWKVTRWDFEGSSIVLTNSSGDVYATFWPRGRDVWVGRGSASGQRLSLSR